MECTRAEVNIPHPLVGKTLNIEQRAALCFIHVPTCVLTFSCSLRMSDYYKSLDGVAKARYLSKLQLLGLDERNDPYISQDFVDNMSLWPTIEYGHIFCYFIERPGVYTKEELLQWKSLEAYNYFLSGHVRTVLVWLVRGSNCCVVKATVNPSQRSPKDAHHAWAAVKKDGRIVAAHCTCMAG